MQMDSNIKRKLIESEWDSVDYNLTKESRITKLLENYLKSGHIPSRKILEELSVFYNMKIKFETKRGLKRILFFSAKKIRLHSCLFIEEQAKKFHVEEVYYIADIDPGYYNVWIDNNEGVWVDFEKEIYYYGKGLFNGIVNIINDHNLMYL